MRARRACLLNWQPNKMPIKLRQHLLNENANSVAAVQKLETEKQHTQNTHTQKTVADEPLPHFTRCRIYLTLRVLVCVYQHKRACIFMFMPTRAFVYFFGLTRRVELGCSVDRRPSTCQLNFEFAPHQDRIALFITRKRAHALHACVSG